MDLQNFSFEHLLGIVRGANRHSSPRQHVLQFGPVGGFGDVGVLEHVEQRFSLFAAG